MKISKKAKILYDHKLYDIYLDIFFLKEYDYDLTLNGNMKDSTYNFKIGSIVLYRRYKFNK